MNPRYLLLRLVRHFMPERVARFMLRRRWIIRPGLETSDPITAANRYLEVLAERGQSVQGRRVLLFGYGGRFGVGVELLRQGAGYVVLCDHYPAIDRDGNRAILEAYEQYLEIKKDGEVQPRSQFMCVLHGDIRKADLQNQIQQVDYVFSNSVFEHLEDATGITRSLANLTKGDGFHVHFIDLRDHYFKYPFEMLTFAPFMWKTFLNPTSNLNRLRVWDYQRMFEAYFQDVEVKALACERDEFEKIRPRIRPEYISGDGDMDSTTLVQLLASSPK